MADIFYGMVANPQAAPAEEIVDRCVGKGWRPILLKLIDELYEAGWDGRVWQIKEKFGGLRFYAPFDNDAQSELVSAAEEICSKTCEVCGELGHLRRGGWIQTLCDAHANGRPAFNTKTE